MFPDKNEESNLQPKFASHYSTPLSIWKPQQADNAPTIHTCTEVRTVLIVPNDYLQFWAHFEWFLSLFQISEVK